MKISLFDCILTFTLLGFIVQSGISQSFYFGPKGGLGLNTQKWNSFDRDPLFSPFFDVFIESYDSGSPSSLYAQIGYHTRGSGLRLFGFNSGNSISNTFKFNNLSLLAAAKRVLSQGKKFRPYYLVGIRAEYTLSTNLEDFNQFGNRIYPVEAFVNKFIYGFTAGGGFEFDLGDLYGGLIEFTVNPDMARQYDQLPINNVISPYNGQSINLPQREIRNLSLEITLGIRFLRKVEYY